MQTGSVPRFARFEEGRGPYVLCWSRAVPEPRTPQGGPVPATGVETMPRTGGGLARRAQAGGSSAGRGLATRTRLLASFGKPLSRCRGWDLPLGVEDVLWTEGGHFIEGLQMMPYGKRTWLNG